MLKRLELVGFKSFADKTVFEFGDGITAIVGPNGSGKSNIVDAVRWIMGEQSAKSLRGGEMADVIFNGSSSRRSLGLAEVTMFFDNRKKQLAIDSEDVQITRRVYRTGEGEYLINGQICRLKDIKDLFLGSGAGNDALSIIAQGKVETLLQSSTKERRAIFEEAAGISRFKAKKIETLRKLERVDQDLQRLKDIIEEVEKQHRSTKLQASKAQRYQEYSTRLKDLRVQLGLQEYGQFTSRVDEESQVLDRLRVELDQRAARAVACEAESERLEIFLSDLEDQLHGEEAKLGQFLQQIKGEQTTLAHETTLSADLETEQSRLRKNITQLTGRVRDLKQSLENAEGDLAESELQAQLQRQELNQLKTEHDQQNHYLTQLQQQLAKDKTQHLELMRRAAHLHNEAVSNKAHLDNLHRERDRLHHRSTLASESLASIDLELQDIVKAEDDLQGRLTGGRQSIHDKKQRRDQLRIDRDQKGEQISKLRQKRSGLTSQIEMLEGLIKSHEGLGTGVREVFELIERSAAAGELAGLPNEDPQAGKPAAPWSAVLGMIADFLTVKREYAPLIDLALGEWAQRFLVRDLDLLSQALSQRPKPFSGRVSFLPLKGSSLGNYGENNNPLRENHLVQVSLLSRVKQTEGEAPTPEHPGLVAPADQVVSCDHPELTDLPSHLLGRTLIVHDLAAARAIAAAAPGFRLITLKGELLEPDGTLTVGTFHAGSGFLSRKSELKELIDQKRDLEIAVNRGEMELVDLRDQWQTLDQEIQEQEEEITVLAEQTADLHMRVQRHRDRRQGIHQEMEVSQGEIKRIDQEVANFESTWQDAEAQAAATEAQVQILQSRIHQADDDLRRLEADRQARQQALTQAQVSLAKVEERLTSLRNQHQQLSRDYLQRYSEQSQGEQDLSSLRHRLLENQQTQLQSGSVLALAFLEKERAQKHVNDMVAQRDYRRQERSRLAQQANLVRNEWRIQQEHFHNRELEVNNLKHQRETLVARLMEDYQLNLAELFSQNKETPTQGEGAAPIIPREEIAPSEVAPLDESPILELPAEPLLDTQAANNEITDLRKKLSRLGSVNMEALQELEELETRSATLNAQYTDLANAKKSLEEIIHKINNDSRRLFVETYQMIRSHFQELFRKLFGGGMADIVLEDEMDVLESGIEIVARPPGKELRSISLLSGGEKTLTAVALLLAIFRSKPSPFCLLDEVDAALDEANIARFTGVIREFLDQSQFIIVTHSKKTMGCADVLYGITMQESGISKQVTIRFEDWVDDKNPELAKGA